MDSDAGGGNGSASVHITALDGIVNVNSLFTIAAFIGVAWNPDDGATSLAPAGGRCDAGDRAESDLVGFHVLAFSCFLFSSLVALCLKQCLRTLNGGAHGHRREWTARMNRGALRAGMLASAAGSVLGCSFLMLAMVNVVEVKLGRIGCAGNVAAVGAVVPLLTLVPAALLIYVGIVLYAFTR